MKIKILSIVALGVMFIACGPSAADQEVHEENRETAEQELEENWEDDLGDMMEEAEEVVEGAESDSSSAAASDSI